MEQVSETKPASPLSAFIIKTEVAPWIEKAKNFVVASVEDQSSAIEMIKNLKLKFQEFDRRFGLTEAVDDAEEKKKAAKIRLNEIKVPLAQAEEILREAIRQFELSEMRRIKLAEQQAEAERRDKENKEKAQLEVKADKAEELGKTELAGAIRGQIAEVRVMPTPNIIEAPKPEGAKMKTVWKARILDPKEVCRLIGEGKLPVTIISFKESELNRFAEQFNQMSFTGLEMYQDVVLTVRTK